jgi:hypothetical protein
MKVETVSVRSNANCSNPVSQQLTPVGISFNLSATSLAGCSYSVSFNPDVGLLYLS